MKAYTDITIKLPQLRIPAIGRRTKVALCLGLIGACGAVIAGNPVVNKPTNTIYRKVIGNYDLRGANIIK
jgi:hypothetical protein